MSETVPEEPGPARADARVEAASGETAGRFLSLLSHELRTPLNAILGYGDLLEGEISGPLSPEQRDQVGRIRSSAWDLLQLIEDILVLAEIEDARISLSREAVDAAAVAGEAVDLVAEDARRKGLVLRVEDAEAPVALTTDPLRLKHILSHLLSHAVRSTQAGMVVLSYGTDQGWACFHVRDTSPGLSAGRIASIFDPFGRAGSENDGEQKRASMRLCVCRRLAQLMGGDVSVESDVGQGSVFSVALPLDHPESEGGRQP